MTRQSRAYAFGLAAVLAWSTVATAFKISLQHLSPAQLVLYASAASLIALLAILACQRRLGDYTSGLVRYWRRSLTLGAINPFVYYLILFQAYALLPAQEAQAINYTWALTMTLLAVPLLRQALAVRDALAALVCYLGVLVIGTRGNVLGMSFSNAHGVVFALASTVLWACYWIFNTRDTREPVLALAQNFSFALPMILLWCAFTDQLHPVAWQGIAGAAYVGALEMGFTFVLWLTAMKLTDSTAKIANLIFLSPILSLALIHLIIGEPIYMSTLAGLALILGGLTLQKLPLGRATLIRPR
ncbi:DMT family transporter [Crenobacter sp. SG2303]|uniref:DMT family transporter n=1 Tax=Crenobacter oryzisoli TaxID=3056844 RepID=A0ABT7XTZ2_9NEIS|nr:DMT family transporter [Crenobacter sp. SG2303]MDN0077267.1 DMT family transporter [Crenobacter sp. SG2303]